MTAQYIAAFMREFTVRAALVALLVRAFVPVGWMPNPDGIQSGSAIVLCTMNGAMPAMMGHDGMPDMPGPKSAHSDFCVFGAAAAHGLPIATVALPTPYPEQIALSVALPRQSLAPRIHSRPQNPRGPPITV